MSTPLNGTAPALEGSPRDRPLKRRLMLGLRVLVSAALLALVLRASSLGEIGGLLSRSLENWPLLLLAAALPGVATLLAVGRWRVLLASVGARPGFAMLLRAFLVGTFFNQLLPSTVGGDVIRGWLLRTDLRSAALSLTVVVLDRVLGISSLCLIGLAAAALEPQVVKELPQFFIVVFIVALGAATLWLLTRPWLADVGRRLFSLRLLERLRDRAAQVHNGLKTLYGAKSNLVIAMVLSVAVQLSLVCQFLVLSRALSVDVSIWELALLVPIVTVVSSLPLAVNGVGLREATLAGVGAAIGFTVEDSVALSLLFVVFMWIYAAVGGILYLLGKRAPEAGRE